MVVHLGNRGKEDYFKFWCMRACMHAHTCEGQIFTEGLGWEQSGLEHAMGMNHLHFWIAGFRLCPMDTIHHSYPPHKVITITQQSKRYGNLIKPTVRFLKCHIGNYQHSLPHSSSSQQIKYPEPETCTAVLTKQNISIDNYSITDM